MTTPLSSDLTERVYDFVTLDEDGRTCEAANARNMSVHVWTVNDDEDMRRLVDLGVDGIMTDYPQRLLEILKPD